MKITERQVMKGKRRKFDEIIEMVFGNQCGVVDFGKTPRLRSRIRPRTQYVRKDCESCFSEATS
jgi:hypothetical protein